MGNEHGKAAGGSSKSSSGESKSAAAGVSESKTPNVSLVQGSANQYQPKIVESDYFNRTNLKMKNFSTRSDGFAPALTMDFSKQFEFAVSSSDDGECTAIRVERYIASGGFAHVFLCRKVLNDGLGEVFAVKFMYKRGDKELSKLAKRSVSLQKAIPLSAGLRHLFPRSTKQNP